MYQNPPTQNLQPQFLFLRPNCNISCQNHVEQNTDNHTYPQHPQPHIPPATPAPIQHQKCVSPPPSKKKHIESPSQNKMTQLSSPPAKPHRKQWSSSLFWGGSSPAWVHNKHNKVLDVTCCATNGCTKDDVLQCGQPQPQNLFQFTFQPSVCTWFLSGSMSGTVSDAIVIALVLQLNAAGSNPTVNIVITCLGVVAWALTESARSVGACKREHLTAYDRPWRQNQPFHTTSKTRAH